MTDKVFNIQKGSTEYERIINKFGYNYAIGTASPQTVWSGQTANSGQYGYGLNTPNYIDLVSTNGSDNQTIIVEGLDADGYDQTEEMTLNGTTTVTSTKIFYRTFRAYNSSDTNLIGDVNGYVTGTNDQINKVLFIDKDHQQTLMAMYTIPKGYTGYVFEYDTTSGKGKESRIYVYIRKPGGVFRLGDLIVLYESVFDKQVPYQKLEAGTDVEIRAQSDANNTNVSARFKMILVNDSYTPITEGK